uniref:Factor associated with neutral sphingomyelinase activation n=1 Tax=Rhipicephalus appendiculatus TaxID=34631 RepID=A0A131Z2H8_RHIAP
MAFIEPPNSERFSLLLLEPGEIYFKDYSVYLYPDNVKEAEAQRRRQKGRLKVCSKSILFVPEDINHPILKFPLSESSIVKRWTGPLLSKLYSKNSVMNLQNDQVVEMLEGNFIKPYVFKREKVSFLFSLVYGSIDECLMHISQLSRASTLSPPEHDSMIAAMVLSWQSRISFDRSCLEDLYESIVLETKANKISPLVINPGLVLLTSLRLYFQPFNNVEPWPHIRINLRDVKRVIRRRFLLRQVGLELYCSESSVLKHLFLSFKTQQERDELYEKLLKQEALNLEDTGQENMMLLWQTGVISNYDYLLYINSLADRSFNDLTQYPVFPWVIGDYKSNTLDLSSSASYRDLSRPLGALSEKRLKKLKDRYAEMAEPKFLYGSHYSTPGFVLYYLVRKMPQYMLCLQNGRFDHPDRMFNSISDTWRNVTTDAADFKELIPEFYDLTCSGDFLVNSQNLDFGKRQNGCAVGDVELPPWAEGPAHFIRTCREALEAPFVSENLHAWIDLIFGYKQSGEEAVLADNVFYHLTYEGSVDLDSIQDIHERHSLEVQIMEFGQTPKQIFKYPHPQRCFTVLPRSLSTASDATPDSLAENVTSSSEETASRDRTSSLSLFAWKRNMTDLTKLTEHMLHKEMVTDVCFSANKGNVFSVSQDSLLKLYSLEQKQQLRSASVSHMALSSCIVMNDKTVVVASWDNYVYLYNMEYGRVTESAMAHEDAVTDLSWKNGMLATASWDSTAKIWKLKPRGDKGGFSLHMELEHESGVACASLDSEGENLVSGTVEGCISLWKLQNAFCSGQFHIHKGSVSAVSFSPDGYRVASCSEDKFLKVLDVQTGTVLFTKDVGSPMRCLSWDGATVFTGCDSGSILVWDLLSAKLVATVPAHSGPVTCIHVSDDGSLIATGGSDGKVVVWQSGEP